MGTLSRLSIAFTVHSVDRSLFTPFISLFSRLIYHFGGPDGKP